MVLIWSPFLNCIASTVTRGTILAVSKLWSLKGSSQTQSAMSHDPSVVYTVPPVFLAYLSQFYKLPVLLFTIKRTWMSHLCDHTFFCVYVVWIFVIQHVLKCLSSTINLIVRYRFLQFIYIRSHWFIMEIVTNQTN